LSALLQTAVKRRVLTENVVRQISLPVRRKNSPRRPFTGEELSKLFAVADSEWTGMIMVALYTGLRIGDVSRLVYRDVDFFTSHIRASEKKTGAFEPKPMPRVLIRYLQTLTWPTNLDTPMFPRAYKWATTGCRQAGRASHAFLGLLIRAGLRTSGKGDHVAKREGANKYAPLSFHCLRHNFTTMLKMAGVPEAVARKIVGHRSVAVSDLYTHLGEDVMLNAVQLVPNIIDASARLAMVASALPSAAQMKSEGQQPSGTTTAVDNRPLAA
jgi:integrase